MIRLNKSLAGYLATGMLCLPLFFINVPDTHDWGDDFAGYIIQAKNIVNGTPQSETGFVYNEDYNDLSVVPNIGFPLLLSPVYYFFGNDVRAFLLFISLILYLLSFALLYFYNRFFTPLVSVFLTLIVVYNPWTLSFKSEILSDLPFTLFLVLTFGFYLWKGTGKLSNCIILGILTGFLISIRTAALALPVALLLYFVISFLRAAEPGEKKDLVKKNLILALSIFAVYFLLNKILFAIPVQGSYLVEDHLNLPLLGKVFLKNLNGYAAFLYTFFRSLGRYELLAITVRSLAVVALFAGVIYKLKRKADLIDVFVLVYLGVILVMASCRERYFFPLVPFLLYYMVLGLQNINLKWNINKNLLASMLGIFVLIQYYPEIKWIVQHQNEVQKGPQQIYSQKAWEYIGKNTPQNSLIVFAKPRVLALYGNRQSMGIEPTSDLKKLKEKFKRKGVDYLLLHVELTKGPVLIHYIKEYKEEVTLEWRNEKFFLYKLKSNQGSD